MDPRGSLFLHLHEQSVQKPSLNPPVLNARSLSCHLSLAILLSLAISCHPWWIQISINMKALKKSEIIYSLGGNCKKKSREINMKLKILVNSWGRERMFWTQGFECSVVLGFMLNSSYTSWVQFSSVAQSYSTACEPMEGPHQASLSITNSQSLLKLMSTESVMPSRHLILSFSCLQYFPASGSFPMSQCFASGGQSIGISPSELVLPMNIQE